MTAHISHTTIDSVDACAQSLFWGKVLGFSDDPEDPNEPGDEQCRIYSPDGRTTLLFVEVPEAKQVKNRIHFDLAPDEGSSREDELARLVDLGATVVADRRRDDGGGWVTLGDPEGNEFCILRAP